MINSANGIQKEIKVKGQKLGTSGVAYATKYTPVATFSYSGFEDIKIFVYLGRVGIINKTDTPIFVCVRVLCFQRQPLYF